MKIVFIKETLTKFSTLLERVVVKHPTLPVLECVHISTNDQTIVLRATNLEVGIELRMSAKIEGEGVCAVPAGVFLRAIHEAPSGAEVVLELTGTTLHITYPGSKLELTTYEVDEFPTLPKKEGTVLEKLDAQVLKRTLQSVLFSVSTSSIKPELASVFVHFISTGVVGAATDSFRLAEKHVVVEGGTTEHPPILIPQKVAQELLRALEYVDEPLTLTVNENQLSFETQDLYFTAQLTQGTFPDYTQILPKEFKAEATVLKQDFQGALRQTALFSNQFNQVEFRVDPKKKVCSMRAEHENLGTVDVEIAAALTGEALSISFNHRYLADVLQVLTTDSIQLSLVGSGQPMLVRGIGDTSFKYLVMPMNR